MKARSIAPIAAALVAAALWAQRPQTPQTSPAGVPAQPSAAQRGAGGAEEPPRTASISGSVVAVGTNQPLAGASVEIRRSDCGNFSNPPDVTTAATDAGGKFTFQKLRAGGWCVTATAPGGAYMPAEYQQRSFKDRGSTLPVLEGQQVTDIQLALSPTGGIAGRILDRDGEALPHARVQLLEPFYEEGRRKLYILQSVPTDDLGAYRFFWVPPGRYYVAVTAEDGRRSQNTTVIPKPGTGGRREETTAPVIARRIEPDGTLTEETYFTVYYPGDTDPDRAAPVDLDPGANVAGIDFLLVRARAASFHVRGTLTNSVTGDPAENTPVRIVPQEWRASIVMPSATTNSKGEFDIPGVLPGIYVLYANLTYRPPAEAPRGGTADSRGGAPPPRGAAPPPPTTPPQARGNPPRGGQNAGQNPEQNRGNAAQGAAQPIALSVRIPLNVGTAHVDNLRLSLAPGTDLPGKARMERTATEIGRGISVSLARDPDIVGAPTPQGRGAVQPDGTFTLAGIGPGDYRVLVAPFITAFQWSSPAVPKALENTFVKSIRYDGGDVLSEGLHLTSAAVTGSLEIVLGTGGTVNGTVVNERHDTLSNVTVALVPEPQFRKRLDLYRSVTTDRLGRFQIVGVAPGLYKAFAWEIVERNAWQAPEFLQPVESRGLTVDISEGGQATADVTAVPARP